jgi:hypothetical protein
MSIGTSVCSGYQVRSREPLRQEPDIFYVFLALDAEGLTSNDLGAQARQSAHGCLCHFKALQEDHYKVTF